MKPSGPACNPTCNLFRVLHLGHVVGDANVNASSSFHRFGHPILAAWRKRSRSITCAYTKRPSGEKRASRESSVENLVKRRLRTDGPNMAFRAELNAHLRYYRVRRFEDSPGLMSPAEQNRSLGSQPRLIQKSSASPTRLSTN